jgi:hypothetical protein
MTKRGLLLEEDLTEVDKSVSHEMGGQWFFPYGSTVIARIRRGKWVMIPAKWRGKVTDPYTIRHRPSKMTGKARRRAKHKKPEAKREKGI